MKQPKRLMVHIFAKNLIPFRGIRFLLSTEHCNCNCFRAFHTGWLNKK